MRVRCLDCRVFYDDARQWTICPHEAIMSEENLKQKDMGLKLLGKRVHFVHIQYGPGHLVRSVGWNGMVSIDGFPGEFAPHLFVEAA